MKPSGVTGVGGVTRKGGLKVRPVTSLLWFASPTEGEDAFGAQMQVLVKTEHGLEMKCFQY